MKNTAQTTLGMQCNVAMQSVPRRGRQESKAKTRAKRNVGIESTMAPQVAKLTNNAVLVFSRPSSVLGPSFQSAAPHPTSHLFLPFPPLHPPVCRAPVPNPPVEFGPWLFRGPAGSSTEGPVEKFAWYPRVCCGMPLTRFGAP